jgi:uncharacterized membrane protein
MPLSPLVFQPSWGIVTMKRILATVLLAVALLTVGGVVSQSGIVSQAHACGGDA